MSPYIQDIDLITTFQLFKVMLFKHCDSEFTIAYRNSNDTTFTEVETRYASAELAVESVFSRIISFMACSNESYVGCVVSDGCLFISEQEIEEISRGLVKFS